MIKEPSHYDGVEIDYTPTAYDYYIPPLKPFEEAFRHSGWRPTRRRVNAALRACHAPANRIDKFEKCGSDCIIEQHTETGELRLRANYCGDRFCIPCCTARGIRLERALLDRIGNHQIKFATFTRRDDGQNLAASLNHLRESWKRLRQQRIWTKHVTAAAYAVEITRGDTGKGWHVHIHALIVASFVDQRDWSDAWKAATGGSPIMHIRACRDTKRDVGYMCKYATKGFDHSVLADHDSLVEAMIALRGRRLVGTLGGWYDLDVNGIIGPKEGWVRKANLNEIGLEALSGSNASIGLLARVRRRSFDDLRQWLTSAAGGSG